MLFTIFNKIWHFEKKMQKTAKTSFFYERDYIYIYYIYFTYILYIYYVLYIYKYMYIYIYIYIYMTSASPLRQTKRPYSSNMLFQWFNGIKMLKTTHTNWLFGWNRPRSTFEIETTKSHFILKSLFRQEHSKSPRQISVAGILCVPQALIFLPIPLSKFRI